jgi:outer membrane protein assembly factor BamB
MGCRRYICLLIALVSSGLDANADWPGLLGPTRDGIASSGSELPRALDSQPQQIWAVDAGQGYAGPAVAGNDFVLFERIGDNDRVRLLNLETGEEVWRRELKAGYRGGIDSDKGPRSVPTILDDSILVYSAAGELTQLDRKSGSVKWTRPLRKEYQAEDGYFGAGSTPLVVGNQAIVNIGGKSAGAVSVALVDGKTIWTSPAAEASYASPILLIPNGDTSITSPIVLIPSKQKTLGVDLSKGSLVWEFPFGQRGPTVNAATPVMTASGDVFLTSSYGIGSLLIRPGQTDVSVISKGPEISSQYSTPVVIDGKIFGSDGREDGGEVAYKCLQASTGKLLWEQRDMPICHSVGVGESVLIVGIDGQIWAIDSSSDSFRTLWKNELPRGKYRALPAFSRNRLYTRTSNGTGDKWFCFQFGGRR